MLKLYYANVSNLNLEKSYSKVSNNRKAKIDNFIFEKDKKLSCGAELLLLNSLKKIGIYDPIFKLTKFEKPYISNYPNIHFNLSHSGEMVACGISDKEIGVDIEKVDDIDLDIAKNYFFNNEYEDIMKSNNSKEKFFEYWVLKESYMKYTGLGFNLELNSFSIEIKDKISLKINKELKDINFNLFSISNYKLAIASSYKNQVKPVEISL